MAYSRSQSSRESKTGSAVASLIYSSAAYPQIHRSLRARVSDGLDSPPLQEVELYSGMHGFPDSSMQRDIDPLLLGGGASGRMTSTITPPTLKAVKPERRKCAQRSSTSASSGRRISITLGCPESRRRGIGDVYAHRRCSRPSTVENAESSRTRADL